MSNATPAPGTVFDWRRLHAFGLPNGSIRALLAILIFGTIWAWLLIHPERGVPDYLQNLMFIIMGHYFAVRSRLDPESEAGPPPLFLPRGLLRLLFVGGFLAVAALLFQQDLVWTRVDAAPGFDIHHGVVTLILVAGFLLGVALSRIMAWWQSRGHRPSRWFENLRASLALVAAAALILLVFGLRAADAKWFDEDLQHWLLKYRVEHGLAGLVGFYFGSRS